MSEWFVFIPIVICSFIFEILGRTTEKKSFHVYLFIHLIETISNLAKEIISDDTGKKLCGYAVAIELIALIILLLIVVISNLFHENLFITLLFLTILMISFIINQWFIAFKPRLK